MKKAIVSLLPKGFAWDVAYNSDLDKELNGVAANLESVREYLETLAFIRTPSKTPVFDDLEKEYGITKDAQLSDETRIMQLESVVYPTINNGSDDNLEKKLRDAGFDVNVYQNDPAINPAIFLEASFRMVAGGPKAFAGNEEAICGTTEGELLVNGDIYEMNPQYIAQAGGATAFAGNQDMVAGRFDDILKEKIRYKTPENPEHWPFVFFVGGAATRDPGDNHIIDIENVIIPTERRDEFIRIILKYKPIDTWATLVVIYL